MESQPEKKAYFLSGKTLKRLEELADGGGLVPDPTQFETLERAGKKHFRLRPSNGPEDAKRGAGRSFVPTVRGTTLTVGRGAVVFVEVRKRPQDGQAPPPRALAPVFPTFEGTPLFPGPAEKDVTGLTGGSLWLITRSDYCSSAVAASGDPDPERVVLAAKDGAPTIERGEMRLLLSTFDLVTVGGGLAIGNLVPHWLSDLVWPFSCEAEGDDDNTDDPSLDDPDPDGSSGPLLPDPAPSSAPSIPDPDPATEDCRELVQITANWAGKPDCYFKDPFGSRKVPVDITVSVALGGDLCEQCPNWWADAWLEKGTPVNPGSATVGADKAIRWPIGCGNRRLLSFEVDPFVPCEKLRFRVRVKSSPPTDPSDSGPCCDTIFSQDYDLTMPPFCGESCSTVV